MYTVTTRRVPSKGSKLSVLVDHVEELSIPPILRIAMSDKEAKFRKHLDDRLYDEKDKQKLLNYMVFLHSKAIEVGSIELVCNCKFSHHVKVIKSFLEDNRETFSTLLPYLFPKAVEDDPDANEKEFEELNSKDMEVPENVRGKLSYDDWNQIQNLMMEHQSEPKINNLIEDAEYVQPEELVQVESNDEVTK